MLSPYRQFWLPKPQSSFSFHTCPPEYTVEDIYPGPTAVPINVLLPSFEDLTVALQNLPVVAAQRISRLHGILTSGHLLARNTLYLKLLQDETFDPTNKDDISYLWNVWYDMKWSSKTRERFLSEINYLCDQNLPSNINVHPEDIKQLQYIWGKWTLMVTEKPDASILEKVYKQRHLTIAGYVQKCMSSEGSTTEPIGNTLEELWDWVWTQTKAQESLKNLPTYYGTALLTEMKSHFITGNSSCVNEETPYLNPIFLNPENMNWDLSPVTSPFESFLLEKCEPREDDVMTPFLRAFSERVQEERIALKSTAFHLIQGNVFDITYRGTLPNDFDVIDFSGLSTLTENIGLQHILNASSLLLSDNPYAILVTESSPWRKHNPPLQTVKEFVEESLGTNLTLIPSLYGFTVRNHLLLGSPLPLLGSNRDLAKLCWKKSPVHENLQVKLFSVDQEFIAKLQDKCFGASADESGGKNSFTPLSYSLFVSSLTARVLLDDAEKTALCEPEVPPNYMLGWKTIEAWMNGGEIVRVEAHFTLVKKETGSLKLVLVNDKLSHEQYLENFQMIREGEALKITFLLLKDNSLDYGKTLVYLSRGARNVQITSHLTLQEAYVENYEGKFPFKNAGSSSEAHFSCDETEYSYCIYLQGVTQENLGVSTDLSHLSEASHEIRINGPDFDKIIRFPWPFKISEVHSIGEPEDEPLRLILPKAIYEPHPFEWDRTLKWSIDSSKEWNNETLTKDLNFHLSAQFQYSDLKRQMMDLPEAEHNGLRGIREVIRTVFQSAVLDGQCWFVIESKHDLRMKNLWFLRVHLPVRISPWGSPMLFLTANDHRLAQKLVDRGILEQAQATEDFKRFFVGGANSSAVASIYIQNEEEENILRYLLRLNSTKVDRCSWPIENLPSGKHSPWLATFLTPSYVDAAGTDEEMSDLLELTNNLAIVSEESKAFKDLKLEPVEFCTKCSKIGNLKRCSRCKSVKYCSLECQKSDWAAHKTKCAQIVASFMPA